RIVKVADWAAERGDAVIVTLGLGSCVAIMLHDANAGAGAMAHILLPSKSLARDVTNLAKFPETAVPLLVEQLTALGAEPRPLLAQLAGWAGRRASPGPASSAWSRRRATDSTQCARSISSTPTWSRWTWRCPSSMAWERSATSCRRLRGRSWS